MDPGLRQDDGIVGVIPAKAGIQSNGKMDCPKILVQDDPRGKPQPLKPATTMNRSLRLPLAYARMTDYCIRHTGEGRYPEQRAGGLSQDPGPK